MDSEPIPQLQAGYRGVSERLQADGSEGIFPFQVVNLRYDLTPIGNISVIATETGLIPPTSIPVLIRELRTDLGFDGGDNPESL
jgi:translation initiation factor 2B subunit (eIF-2B alpha/beta/delta family)